MKYGHVTPKLEAWPQFERHKEASLHSHSISVNLQYIYVAMPYYIILGVINQFNFFGKNEWDLRTNYL